MIIVILKINAKQVNDKEPLRNSLVLTLNFFELLSHDDLITLAAECTYFLTGLMIILHCLNMFLTVAS